MVRETVLTLAVAVGKAEVEEGCVCAKAADAQSRKARVMFFTVRLDQKGFRDF